MMNETTYFCNSNCTIFCTIAILKKKKDFRKRKKNLDNMLRQPNTCLFIFLLTRRIYCIADGNHKNVSSTWRFGRVLTWDLTRSFYWPIGHEKNIEVQLDITFEDAFFGKDFRVAVERLVRYLMSIPFVRS